MILVILVYILRKISLKENFVLIISCYLTIQLLSIHYYTINLSLLSSQTTRLQYTILPQANHFRKDNLAHYNTIPLLAYFDPNLPLILETNALDSVIASVFYQQQSNREQHLVAYYSKTIVNTKLNYLIYNKEMLAIVSSFQYQQVHLKETLEIVQVMLDYKALEYFITTKALTIQQAHQAKIFTKLDICQAFHHVYIDLALEDLTTFRI